VKPAAAAQNRLLIVVRTEFLHLIPSASEMKILRIFNVVYKIDFFPLFKKAFFFGI
jgi:hypothetical protein